MKIGDAIKYHSPYRTGVYDGTITALNADGTVAINVEIPNVRDKLGSPVNLRSVTYGLNGLARPI